MRPAFDERELDEAALGRETAREAERETDITLGSVGLLIVLACVFVVCGAAFALGYAIGHHSSSPLAAASPAQPTPDAPLAASAGKQKPQAAPQPAQQSVAPPIETNAAPADQRASDPDGDVVSVASPAKSSNPTQQAGQPSLGIVRPALPESPTSVSSSIAPQSAVLMVQIAAVSHAEDAEVLVNALRRRGYAVSVRRDPLDNLLHVKVGPFTSRADANAMKLKLLNDGYNAIVEP